MGTVDEVDETELPQRLAGRVIVLDPGGRLLLFKYDDGPPNGTTGTRLEAASSQARTTTRAHSGN
jgi:hypothetical protein